MSPSSTGRRLAVFGAALALLLVLCCLSMAIGRQPLTPAQVVRALFAHGSDTSSSTVAVVRGLRLQRTVVALVVGAALGAAGALAQALTRNPLADPGLLGVNAGAAAAVVTGIAFLGVTSGLAQVWLALGGAAVASVAVHLVGTRGRAGATPARLALAGAALTAVLFSYINALAFTDQQNYDALRFWVVGSVVNRGWPALVAALPFLVVGAVVALGVAPALNALAMGEDTGRSLGVGVGRVRVATAAAVVLLAGASTAVTGPLAFLGLVVPHAARTLVGPDERAVVPLSMLLASGLLVLCDTLGRVVGSGAEVQAGIVAAVLGAPVFIALVRRRRLVAL